MNSLIKALFLDPYAYLSKQGIVCEDSEGGAKRLDCRLCGHPGAASLQQLNGQWSCNFCFEAGVDLVSFHSAQRHIHPVEAAKELSVMARPAEIKRGQGARFAQDQRDQALVGAIACCNLALVEQLTVAQRHALREAMRLIESVALEVME